MLTFKYSGRDADGGSVRGAVEAGSETGARVALLELGLVDVAVRERRRLRDVELTPSRIPLRDVMHFSRQLAAFLRAGVAVLDALRTLAEDAGNKAFRRVLLDVGDSIRVGEPFSAALRRHPKAFPPFYLAMVQAAELSGRLDTVLVQVARYIERDLDARRRIKSALAYPGVILAMSLVTVAVLTTFVMPRFEQFFDSLGADLPLATRLLLGVIGFLTTWWWAIAGAAAAAAALVASALRTERGRRVRDRLLLHVPVVGAIVEYAAVERFSRVLSSMVQAGVPLPDAMTVVADATTNRTYRRAVLETRQAMLRGEGIARPVADSGRFPSALVQMMRVGEDTGTLDEQLEMAAEFYDQELTYKIKNATTLFEPAVLVFMGVVVGFVAVALVSAMYGIFDQAGTL